MGFLALLVVGSWAHGWNNNGHMTEGGAGGIV